jgi:hypothetical protein
VVLVLALEVLLVCVTVFLGVGVLASCGGGGASRWSEVGGFFLFESLFLRFRPFSDVGGSASWCFSAPAVDWKFGLFPELRWCFRCVMFLDPEVLDGFGAPVVFLVSFGVLLQRDGGALFGGGGRWCGVCGIWVLEVVVLLRRHYWW